MNFSVGDKALFVVATTFEGQQFIGEVVDIDQVGPWPDIPETGGREYACSTGDDPFWGVVFGWQLRKLDPPPEPSALTRIHDEELEKVQ